LTTESLYHYDDQAIARMGDLQPVHTWDEKSIGAVVVFGNNIHDLNGSHRAFFASILAEGIYPGFDRQIPHLGDAIVNEKCVNS
jgi:hypothetical protein